MKVDIAHPALRVVEYCERLWMNEGGIGVAQAHAQIVLRALVEAGFIADAEISRGMVVRKESDTTAPVKPAGPIWWQSKVRLTKMPPPAPGVMALFLSVGDEGTVLRGHDNGLLTVQFAFGTIWLDKDSVEIIESPE